MEPVPERLDPGRVRIAVVGPCASGKTTLVERLKSLGYDAWVTAQEHSAIRELWNHQHPDVLVALRTDLQTIRERRGDSWPEAVYEAQQERLESAYQAADVTIDTANVPVHEALNRVVTYLRRDESDE